MALVVKDRVQETSTTTGTGTFTLGGAVSGFQSFSAIGNGNTTYYAIVLGSEWEVGLGTYTSSGTTLSRDTILESSNSGSAVNFSAGTKNVFVTYPAEKGLYTDASGNAIALGTPASATLTNATGLPISTGVSGLGTNVATFLATPTSANLAAVLTDETGTGANVFATSPTLVTPILGTPSSGTLTSCTGLPLTTGVTGTLPIANGGTGTTSTTFANLTTNVTGTLPVANGGTGVTSSTGSGNVVLSTSPTLVTPVLGTPSSGTVTNLTGTASININGTVGATTPTTGAFTTLSASGVATFSAGSVSAPALTTTGDTNTGMFFPAADTIAFATGGADRWRIDSSGGLSSRTAFASGGFAVSIGVSGAYPVDRGIAVSNSAGSAIPLICYTSSTTQAGYILTSGSTISFVQGSDYRLKEDIIDMDKAATLSKLMQVKPVNFDWKDGTKINQDGFIAHELQAIFPQVIHGEKDAVNEDGSINPQGINLAQLIPYLVASIQEQQKLITTLQEQVLELQTKVGS